MRTALWIGSGALALLLGILAFRPASKQEEPAKPGTASNTAAPQPQPPQGPMLPKPDPARRGTPPPPPRTMEELAKDAAELNLPAPPPADADDKTVREYARSLDVLARGMDAEQAGKVHDFMRSYSYMRSRHRSGGEQGREEARRRHEEMMRQREARRAEWLKLHPEDPNKPKPEPLFPPPELGPPVSGVEKPSESK